jgi:hypothetical protein
MIGPIILAVAAVLFVAGIFVVVWDYAIRNDPDAPHGGPIVIIAVVGMLCGGVVSCAETMEQVRELQRNVQK